MGDSVNRNERGERFKQSCAVLHETAARRQNWSFQCPMFPSAHSPREPCDDSSDATPTDRNCNPLQVGDPVFAPDSRIAGTWTCKCKESVRWVKHQWIQRLTHVVHGIRPIRSCLSGMANISGNACVQQRAVIDKFSCERRSLYLWILVPISGSKPPRSVG